MPKFRGLRGAGADLAAELAIHVADFASLQVFFGDDVKAQRAQLAGHGARVIHRIGQWALLVGGVADHQRDALVLRRVAGSRAQIAGLGIFGSRGFGSANSRLLVIGLK